ncbi:alpha/beta hydrolase [Robiginitalea aurantiaca]|uniref:Esterase n=1 Tax=Robiginitalea aurantiaca TaxID=3056915 RepID=A0ABT7WG57_9FLAO|nr:esterase [Robiginitalea aurantiaca]MDM9631902.1 esterase [Robiginitalea aurantiaca]
MSSKHPLKTAEKHLSIQSTHPYETLNERTPETKNVWVVFHGIGYLSRYFLRHFQHLDPKENYIVCPQAPSLYYLDKTYTHIGASWLTRENTGIYMENLLHLFDELYLKEGLDTAPSLVLMGYSQGVSVLCRWITARKLKCNRLVLYAGRVPDELEAADFAHLPTETPVEFYIGDSDPFITALDRKTMMRRLEGLFGDRLQIREYSGGHNLNNSHIVG